MKLRSREQRHSGFAKVSATTFTTFRASNDKVGGQRKHRWTIWETKRLRNQGTKQLVLIARESKNLIIIDIIYPEIDTFNGTNL